VRTAVVTGGMSGLGAACVERLRADGLRVVTLDRADGADHLVDVADTEQVERAVAAVGTVDVLVNSAGVVGPNRPLWEVSDEEWRRTFEVNVEGTFHLCRAVVPGMVERGWGRVVAVSASIAVTTPPNLAAYSVAKAAEETLLRTLAREVAANGVTVNVLVGRKIDTDHERETAPTPKNAPWTTPEEVASAMLFLCADEAAAVTGARIALDGRA